MKTVRSFVGLCLLMCAAAPVRADTCSDLQAAITKATALRSEMQREASPLLSAATMPVRHEGVCTAAQKLRDHIVVLAKMIEPKCLNEAQQKNVTFSVDVGLRDANNNIGLFCN